MTARPNNHTGPYQSPQFFVPSFAQQIKAISRGVGESVLNVGNLDSKRNIMDVRDVVRAYSLLLEKGHAGEAYNISSQNVLTVRQVLERLCDLAGVHPKIGWIPGNSGRRTVRLCSIPPGFRLHTGWTPRIGITDTLKDILSEA